MKVLYGITLLASTASAFAPHGARPTSRTLSSASSTPTAVRAPLLLKASVPVTNSESPDDMFMKQVEKKEAELLRRKEEAEQRLAEYEQSLEVLQTKKAEYLVATPDGPPAFTETAVRSAVKAFIWRIIAGSVTFATTLRFSGSVSAAIKVVGADFFSKAFTMFIGERLMNKSQAGRKSGADNVGRSFAKALIWRLFAIANTLTMAVFIAKDLSVASKIASTDAVFKTGLMFFYERVWARIQWGKEYLMEWSI